MITPADAISFHCTACGKCCNSGPQLSLPELFHHETRFIGCLTLRRVRLIRAGEKIAQFTVDSDDERAFATLTNELLHPLPTADHALLLATQAFYDASANRCPALGTDALCSVQHDRKPGACSVAPLEAWLPDSLQHHVLHGRIRSADYVGADCISAGEHAETTRVITRKRKLVQTDAHDVLAQRRADLRLEKRHWGDAVFATLARDLLGNRAALARIPTEGFVSIPPAPILRVIAAVSERCRLRCLRFLNAQIALIAGTHSIGHPELSALYRTAQALRTMFAQDVVNTRALHADAVEHWLGISDAPSCAAPLHPH